MKKNCLETLIHTTSPEETVLLGFCIGKSLVPGTVLALIGHMGAGKTWMSRGIGDGLGIAEHHHIHSPAFDLIHEHPGKIPMYHMDFYRLDDFSREDELWVDEYIHSKDGVCVIEWADKFIINLLDSYLKINLEMIENDTTRKISFCAIGEKYNTIIENVIHLYEQLNR